MNKNSENKYQVVADLMEAYCAECESRESDQCLIKEKSCGKFESKYRELYFELLYPMHPCRFCIVRPTCDVNGRCEEYRHHIDMRELAHCQLTGEEVDAEFTERYVTDLKGDPLYDSIFETERQYLSTVRGEKLIK